MTNFDSIYQMIIAPAVQQAGLEPVRADEEKIGGTIHKPMFERLMLCPRTAVADINRRQSERVLRARHPPRIASPQHGQFCSGKGPWIPFDNRAGARPVLQDRWIRRAARGRKRDQRDRRTIAFGPP